MHRRFAAETGLRSGGCPVFCEMCAFEAAVQKIFCDTSFFLCKVTNQMNFFWGYLLNNAYHSLQF